MLPTLAFVGLSAAASPILLSSNFDSPTGAAPQTTATRTMNVPTGNSGHVRIQFTGASGSPSPRRSIDGGTFIVFVDGAIINTSNAGTLAFRNQNASSSISLQLYDVDTGRAIGSPFTITCS